MKLLRNGIHGIWSYVLGLAMKKYIYIFFTGLPGNVLLVFECNDIYIESPALLQFFVLDGGTEARCIIGAVHIFAVMGAVNYGRTCGTPVDHGTLRDILWERWRTAMTQHRPLLR